MDTSRLPLKGKLTITHRNPDGISLSTETMEQTVLTLGKNWVVDAFRGATAIVGQTNKLRYHQSGVGTAVALAANTGLQTPRYSRATGTRTEGSTPNVYVSAVTISYTGTQSITEWAIFYTSSGSSTAWSRKTFAAKSVGSGDTLTFNWRVTVG